jgi:hypothetical protein
LLAVSVFQKINSEYAGFQQLGTSNLTMKESSALWDHNPLLFTPIPAPAPVPSTLIVPSGCSEAEIYSLCDDKDDQSSNSFDSGVLVHLIHQKKSNLNLTNKRSLTF